MEKQANGSSPKPFKAYRVGTGLFMLAIFLGLFWHYPIRIVDALSGEPVPGYGIHVTVWRLLTEPFSGPLLFYLRADQPVKEFAVLLYWILALSLIMALLRPLNKWPALLSWLKSVPLMVVLWLGLLWFMIIFPLPANTIVNEREANILVNTHSHTEYSHDGIISTVGLQRWHKRNGYDAFFITEHNHHVKTLETMGAQVQGRLPEEPLILAGEEFSGSNHMTLLGLTRNFSTRGISDQQVIDSTHDDQGIVIVAHWFDEENESIPYFLGLGVDGFEIANQGSGLTYERRIFNDIVNACKSNELLMIGAADYHGYGSSCAVWNAMEIPGWHQMDQLQKRESILQVLRSRDRTKMRVLLYRDRDPFDRSLVLLSPLFNVVSYFRTLGVLQFLSWVLWFILLSVIRSSLPYQSKGERPYRSLRVLALFSSLFLLVNGIVLLMKSKGLTAFNDIYKEYSSLLMGLGAAFLVYSMIMVYLEYRRDPSLKNLNKRK